MGMDPGSGLLSTTNFPPCTLYRFLAIPFGWTEAPSSFASYSVQTGLCPPEPAYGNFSERLSKNRPVYFERNLRSIAALAQSEKARILLTTFAWDTAAAKKELAANQSLDGTRALDRN